MTRISLIAALLITLLANATAASPPRLTNTNREAVFTNKVSSSAPSRRANASGHVVITDLPAEPGDYYLLLRRSRDGTITIVRIPPHQVISLSGDDVPDPPPDDMDELRKVVRDATDKVDDRNKPTAKLALSRLYGSLAGLPFQNVDALVRSTNLMFGALSLPAPWNDWKATVDTALAEYTTLAAAKAAWRVVAEVLDG